MVPTIDYLIIYFALVKLYIGNYFLSNEHAELIKRELEEFSEIIVG